MSLRVLLLASQGDEADRIAAKCRTAFGDVTALHGDWGQPFPAAAADWSGDIILSYCSRWIVPQWLLDRASIALNFHPAPPEYPGIGGLNWALYEGRDTFGVTCHHMVRKVDAGPIVEVSRFPIFGADDVGSLFDRSHLALEALACKTIDRLACGAVLPSPNERWNPVTRSRAELDAMMDVPVGASDSEVARRRRAFEFSRWKLRMPLLADPACVPGSAFLDVEARPRAAVRAPKRRAYAARDRALGSA